MHSHVVDPAVIPVEAALRGIDKHKLCCGDHRLDRQADPFLHSEDFPQDHVGKHHASRQKQ